MLFTPADLGAVSLAGRTVIVVDVLRATTTVATALAAGAPAVYPVEGIEEARRLAAELGGAVLGGERGGLPGYTCARSDRGAWADGRVPLISTGGAPHLQYVRCVHRAMFASRAGSQEFVGAAR